MKDLKLNWLFLMAWRDSRRTRMRLLLFTASIMLGVAALVAINSFGNNLRKDIDSQAKELLGADLVVESNRAYSDSAKMLLDSLGGIQSSEYAFSSMVYFPKNEGTRPVQVRAVNAGFPFYGEFQTVPKEAGRSFLKGKQALVDQTLMLQFNAHVGDSIKVGKSMFEIAGKLLQVPGQNSFMGAIYAPVYIPMNHIEETDLIKKGSRVRYKRYFQFLTDIDVDELMESKEQQLKESRLRYDTVSERKEGMGNAFNNLTRFLNLVAFLALLLGCLGVASSVFVYIRDKVNTVAILRCLGASGTQTFLIYLIQTLAMGLIGSIAGAILGTAIQSLLPIALQDFLPVNASFAISWPAIIKGIGVGIGIAVLFSLIPLLSIRKVSPLLTLRSSVEQGGFKFDWAILLVVVLIDLFIWLFTFMQIGDIQDIEIRDIWSSRVFTLSIEVGFLFLSGVAFGIMWAVRKYFPKNWGYLLRQSLANLYRPNNQTLILVVSIGLGTAIISTMYFMQGMLLNELSLSDQNDRPNMVVFDIEPATLPAIRNLASEYGFPAVQDVPVVSMRLSGINGRSRIELLRDTASTVGTGTLNREYRITFRDSLIDSEEIVAGEWVPRVNSPDDSIFISVEEGFAKRGLKVELGDEVEFDISGVKMKTYVKSFRKVDFARVQTNFIVLFPAGVLEDAPQFRVFITRTSSNEASAKFQQQIAKEHPNVSVIDLALILQTVQGLLDKVSFVIQFMALFSIGVGLLVLIGSVINSKYQRIQESVLLRTLGASRRQILLINALEYLFLGILASGMGIILALVGSWALAKFEFEIDFAPDWQSAMWVIVGITLLTITIGLLNIRGILNKSPLEILRKEI